MIIGGILRRVDSLGGNPSIIVFHTDSQKEAMVGNKVVIQVAVPESSSTSNLTLSSFSDALQLTWVITASPDDIDTKPEVTVSVRGELPEEKLRELAQKVEVVERHGFLTILGHRVTQVLSASMVIKITLHQQTSVFFDESDCTVWVSDLHQMIRIFRGERLLDDPESLYNGQRFCEQNLCALAA